MGMGFLELLIIVGILVILAGVVLGNYQDASVRAKLSRVLSDHRVCSMAIENYIVDHNSPPRMAHQFYGDPLFDEIYSVPVSGVMSKSISTPVAYLTSAYMMDPFMANNNQAPLDERLYTYQVIPEYIKWNPDSEFWPRALIFYGFWRLGSVGPDQIFDHGFSNSAQLIYDPTNGTVSRGNIWRSHNRNEEYSCPSVPALLGEH